MDIIITASIYFYFLYTILLFIGWLLKKEIEDDTEWQTYAKEWRETYHDGYHYHLAMSNHNRPSRHHHRKMTLNHLKGFQPASMFY